LNIGEDRDHIANQYNLILHKNLDQTNVLTDEMEKKRRKEEALK